MPVTLPSTPLATQADLDALAARVAALEHDTPPVDKPSPDGTTTQTPGVVLIDKHLAKWALVADTVRPPNRISYNGAVDPVTGNVSKIGVYSGGQLFQWATGGVWVADGNGAWTATADPTLPPPQPGTLYKVANGQIYDPAGKVFKARGPNVKFLNWPDNQDEIIHFAIADKATCNPLLSTFPGTTAIRLDCFEAMSQFGVAQPAALYPWIDALVAKGVVVEVECHVYPGVLQGNDLNQVCAWYAALAAHYKDQPRVWWGTQNEPDPNTGDVNAMLRGIIGAIRGAGNNSPIMICVDSYNGLDGAFLAQQHNLVWDQHFYGWTSGYSTDQNTVNANLLGYWQTSQQYRSADGVIPMIVGEFGTAGYWNPDHGFVAEGQGIDANWQQVLTAVYTAPYLSGYLQWNYNTPNTSTGSPIIDLLLLPPYDGSGVTRYGGQQLRAAIASGA